MIEAVNSVLANAQLSRQAVEQSSSARSFAANPDRIQEVAQAPFVSPYIQVDVNYNKAILQIRDGDTGDVLHQFPTENQLKAYRKAQEVSESKTETEIAAAHGDTAETVEGSETSAPTAPPPQASQAPQAAPAAETPSTPSAPQIQSVSTEA